MVLILFNLHVRKMLTAFINKTCKITVYICKRFDIIKMTKNWLIEKVVYFLYTTLFTSN